MIVHLAPRRVSLVSKDDGQQNGISIDLNTVLAVDIQVGAAERVGLVVLLTNGERVTACSYARMAEAGPDCVRLRVLAGLPARGNSTDASPSAPRPRRRQIYAMAALVLAAALIAFLLAVMELRGAGPPAT